jgi:hypothetical protein
MTKRITIEQMPPVENQKLLKEINQSGYNYIIRGKNNENFKRS